MSVRGLAGVLLFLAPVAGAEDGERFVEGDAAPEAAATPPAEAPPTRVQPPLGQIPPEVLEAAVEARHLPLPERMKAVSDVLLGRDYVSDPLGEGQGYDADPFARYDVFDCLTFVEEVVALSVAGDPAHAAAVRDGLRYGLGGSQLPGDAPRTYATRRHFMELQWIPGNVADGWLVDTTREYGETVHLEREVTAATWKAWGRRSLFRHTDEELPVGVMQLDVLPLDVALEAMDRIRPGSIILTVREDRPWIPIWVTHVGFLVPGETPTVRHATKMGAGLSRDHDFAWYLRHIGTYSNWKTLGIAVLEPVEQGPRRLDDATAEAAGAPSAPAHER